MLFITFLWVRRRSCKEKKNAPDELPSGALSLRLESRDGKAVYPFNSSEVESSSGGNDAG